jgi:ribonuclease III
MGPAADLAERLGLPVHDLGLLEQALVHSSWLHEHRDAARGHNERLEFLGDVVVNLAISEALFEAHPSDDEGLLSTRRASIVSTTGLARLAGRIDLGAMLLLGEGEAQRGGRRRPSLLASAFEAVAGALYLDLGWERTRRWLVNLAEPELSNPSPGLSLKSPKSRLQEHTQRRTGARPEYRIVAASGPDHEKLFRIEVWVDGRPFGVGEGPSRRTAETAAATRALEQLRREAAAASLPSPVGGAPAPIGDIAASAPAEAGTEDATSDAEPASETATTSRRTAG